MSQDKAELAASWRSIYGALKREGPRTYAEINSGLRSIINRMGYPGKTARDLEDQFKADEVAKYGRELTLDERLELLRKRMAER